MKPSSQRITARVTPGWDTVRPNANQIVCVLGPSRRGTTMFCVFCISRTFREALQLKCFHDARPLQTPRGN